MPRSRRGGGTTVFLPHLHLIVYFLPGISERQLTYHVNSEDEQKTRQRLRYRVKAPGKEEERRFLEREKKDKKSSVSA